MTNILPKNTKLNMVRHDAIVFLKGYELKQSSTNRYGGASSMNSREYTESSIYSRGTCEDWIKAEVLCYVLKGHGGDGGHNFKNQSEDSLGWTWQR
jgi:hypothetical protein